MANSGLFRRALGGIGRMALRASGEGQYYGLDDPRLAELLRFGRLTASGFEVSVEKALRNPTMLRACSLIANSIGMLPVHLIDKETKEKAKNHPLYRVMHRRPNASQTGYDFRAMMQLRALVHRDAFAQIVRSKDIRTGKRRVIELRPFEPRRVEAKLMADWTTKYWFQPEKGGRIEIDPADVFHLRGLSLDGLHGLSIVEQAAEAIGLALSAELASARLFKNGSFVDSALKAPKKLSQDAYDRLTKSLDEKRGAGNAGKNLILEEGLEFQELGTRSARDAQLLEVRKMQVEEIGRATGVPRPLLMVDETSWGSGISALGNFFVQYALNPWFEAWQQAAERSLIDEADADQFEVKFNPYALLRGTPKDQAEFFSKALGAGGAPAFMSQNDVRGLMDLPPDADPASSRLSRGSAAASTTDTQEDDDDAPKQAA